MSDFTVLIQGPYKPKLQLILGHKNYARYGPVVVSCYDEDDTSCLDQEDSYTIIKKPMPDDTQISIPSVHPHKLYPDLTPRTDMYYQLYSTYNGVKNIRTKYVIKTRSDEFYEDLNPFINKFLENDNTIVCGSHGPFHRAWNEVSHHIGDHLFIVKTDVLKNATKKLLDMYTVLPKDKPEQERAIAKYKAAHLALDKKAKEIESAGPDNTTNEDLNEYKKLTEAFDKLGSCPCANCQPDNPWGPDTIEVLEDWAMVTCHRKELRRQGVTWSMNFENVLCKSMFLAMGIPHLKLNCRQTASEHIKLIDSSEAQNFIMRSNTIASYVGFEEDVHRRELLGQSIPDHNKHMFPYSSQSIADSTPDHVFAEDTNKTPELEQVKNLILEKIPLSNNIAGIQIRPLE